ncbi:MAG TPA: hypothetical protein VFA20_20955 [Myxococcaceae bacterium]|nr:hypothetical protein [Myxococcaceae bacterium]
MLIPRFCNYYTDYQQRLGFLKVLARTGEGVRGGHDQYVARLEELYNTRGARRGNRRAVFDPEALLQRTEIPSWQVGFYKPYLGRLVNWGEMCGIIAANGRLSEWARILLIIGKEQSEERKENPFILSEVERAFFLQLLLVHDQVLRDLIVSLGQRAPGTRLGVLESCLVTLDALGSFADGIQGPGIEAVQLRVELRNLLERIARKWKFDRTAFMSPDRRAEALAAVREEGSRRKPRNRLLEMNAICRFEQLTDLGLLVKEPAGRRDLTGEQRRAVRTGWDWEVAPGLNDMAYRLASNASITEILTHHWIEVSTCGMGPAPLKELQKAELVEVLDRVLPMARRQLGPVQVHTWATLASLEALRGHGRLEIGQVHELLDALQRDPGAGDVIRQGGRPDFLGRTAVVSRGGLSSLLSSHGSERRGGDRV